MKWYVGETFRVGSVDQAVALAEQFKADGKFDWFRGQLQAWPPRSSLFRAQAANPRWEGVTKPLWDRFANFCGNTPELKHLLADEHALLAIGQHYGLPSPYIDFSTQPSIAGFFATDTGAADHQGEACIHCVKTDDLREAWDTLKTIRTYAELDLVTTEVTNLWRLEAQRGVFLYVQPGNWDEWFEPDKIVFPYGGPPAYPPRQYIYPDQKSSLEILLDQFFMTERMKAGMDEMRKLAEAAGVAITTIEAEKDYFLPAAFRDGALPPHVSWSEVRLTPWRQDAVEAFGAAAGREIPLRTLRGTTAEELAERIRAAVLTAIRLDGSLRQQRVRWKIGPDVILPDEGDNGRLEAALRWAWDGMRRLPYSDEQVAAALGCCARLFSYGLGPATQPREEADIASAALGPSIEIEMGAPDGSYARAYAPAAAIAAAWREDLPSLVSPTHAQLLEDPRRMLLTVYGPTRLFRLEGICQLLSDILIPWQVLTEIGHVAFFSPARLETFGLP